ncbi:MAG: DUF4258 domain-containing protein [Chitinophagaceae bacterium]|nr:MAG: DUF4258 domain-containing protein [Chitinophagaceae bacterium]
MNKKYIPIIAFLAAALFYYWVKTKQRGTNTKASARFETPVLQREFNRSPTAIIYSKHARCRMDCRQIDESEVKEILSAGQINESKIETSNKGTSYPLEGTTHDNQRVRIVFAPKEDGKMVVVTVIDLETDFACDCR